MIDGLLKAERYAIRRLKRLYNHYDRQFEFVESEIDDLWEKGDYRMSGDERARYERLTREAMGVLGIDYETVYPGGNDFKEIATISLITWLSMSTAEVQYEVARDVFFNSAKIETPPNVLQSAFSKMDIASNYEQRIINNVTLFSSDVSDIVKRDFERGVNPLITTQKVKRMHDIDEWKAKRLVMTENNYFYNQGELIRIKEEGQGFYIYNAVLDDRTSDICRELDMRQFRVDDALVGENFPPMHPNCRSTVDGMDQKDLRPPERGGISREEDFDDIDKWATENEASRELIEDMKRLDEIYDLTEKEIGMRRVGANRTFDSEQYEMEIIFNRGWKGLGQKGLDRMLELLEKLPEDMKPMLRMLISAYESGKK